MMLSRGRWKMLLLSPRLLRYFSLFTTIRENLLNENKFSFNLCDREGNNSRLIAHNFSRATLLSVFKPFDFLTRKHRRNRRKTCAMTMDERSRNDDFRHGWSGRVFMCKGKRKVIYIHVGIFRGHRRGGIVNSTIGGCKQSLAASAADER